MKFSGFNNLQLINNEPTKLSSPYYLWGRQLRRVQLKTNAGTSHFRRVQKRFTDCNKDDNYIRPLRQAISAIQCKKQLEVSQLNEKQYLKCQVMVLRRKIEQFERQSALRIRKKHVKNPEEQKQQQNQSVSESAEQNKRIVTFDDQNKQDSSDQGRLRKRSQKANTENKTKPIQKQKRKYHRRDKNQIGSGQFERRRRGPKGPRTGNISHSQIRDKNIKQKQTGVTPKQSQNSKYVQFHVQKTNGQDQIQIQNVSKRFNKNEAKKVTNLHHGQRQKLNKKDNKNSSENQISLSNQGHVNSIGKNQQNVDSNLESIQQIGDKVRINFKNGDYYYGSVKDGIYHGFGLYYSKANGTYQGQWKNGVGEGFGISTDNCNNRYQGMHVNDRKHGKGKDFFSTGQKYQGQFVNGAREGYGIYYFVNGDKFEGEWKNDLQHGKGIYTYANGSYYEGTWVNDQKHGYGVQTASFGKVQQFWQNGKLLEHKFLVKVEQPL